MSNLLINPGFENGVSGWGAQDCTIASVAGGLAGNCLEITRVSYDYQGVYQTFGTAVNNDYNVVAHIKSGSSGDEPYVILLWDPTNGTIGLADGISASSWQQHVFQFRGLATESRIYLRKNSATAGTMLFDEIVIERIPKLYVYYTPTAFDPYDYAPHKYTINADGSLTVQSYANDIKGIYAPGKWNRIKLI